MAKITLTLELDDDYPADRLDLHRIMCRKGIFDAIENFAHFLRDARQHQQSANQELAGLLTLGDAPQDGENLVLATVDCIEVELYKWLRKYGVDIF